MTPEAIFVSVIAGLIVILSALIIIAKKPKRLKKEKYTYDWRELQKLCKDKSCWPEAIIAADRLLDKALKKRKFSGKSMGERMVSAQKVFSDNDGVWFAHNLYKKVVADPEFKIKEADVKDALVGFRQALRDLGALENGQSSNT